MNDLKLGMPVDYPNYSPNEYTYDEKVKKFDETFIIHGQLAGNSFYQAKRLEIGSKLRPNTNYFYLMRVLVPNPGQKYHKTEKFIAFEGCGGNCIGETNSLESIKAVMWDDYVQSCRCSAPPNDWPKD